MTEKCYYLDNGGCGLRDQKCSNCSFFIPDSLGINIAKIVLAANVTELSIKFVKRMISLHEKKD